MKIFMGQMLQKSEIVNYSQIPYSILIWQSIILAIGDLRSKSPLLKLPIINTHAHSNAHVHQITKLKIANYICMEKSPK